MITCTKCGDSFSSCWNGKWLKNRTRCFKCSPFQPGGASQGGGKARNAVWYARQKKLLGEDPITMRRKARREFILALVNTQCQFCGYQRFSKNLAFHHLGNKEQKLTVREFQNRLPDLLRELLKCVVACHNCHGEIHGELITLKKVREKQKDFANKLISLEGKKWSDVVDHFARVQQKYDANRQRILEEGREQGDFQIGLVDTHCSKCGNAVQRYSGVLNKYEPLCGDCHNKPKAVWPSHEKLALLVWEKPVTQIAKEIGVSDKAVAKRCRKLSITVPGPGYWSKQRSKIE